MARVAAVCALIGLTLAVYAPVRDAGWVYEDRQTQIYQPRLLTTETWQLVATPSGAHLLNLSLHLVLAALVVTFARRLGVHGLGLWAAAILWLLHPLNVETVAYAASRGELLAALGLVWAAILATWRWWRRLSPR